MRRFLLPALLLLCAIPASAANIAYCDTSGVPFLGWVSSYARSVSTTANDLANHGVDRVVNPDVSSLISGGVPVKYWRCNAAPAVVEMNASQKGQIDAYLDGLAESGGEVSCKAAVDVDPAIRVAFKVMIDSVNELRALHSLAAITLQEAKQDYDAKCEETIGGGGEVVALTTGGDRTRVVEKR
jgi:hypothetical protein